MENLPEDLQDIRDEDLNMNLLDDNEGDAQVILKGKSYRKDTYELYIECAGDQRRQRHGGRGEWGERQPQRPRQRLQPLRRSRSGIVTNPVQSICKTRRNSVQFLAITCMYIFSKLFQNTFLFINVLIILRDASKRIHNSICTHLCSKVNRTRLIKENELRHKMQHYLLRLMENGTLRHDKTKVEKETDTKRDSQK